MSNREVKIQILTELQKLDLRAWPKVSDMAKHIDLEFDVVKKACDEMNQDGKIKLKKSVGSGGDGSLQLQSSGREYLDEIEQQALSQESEKSDQVNVNINQSNVAIGGSSVVETNNETSSSNGFPWAKSIMAGIVVAIIVGAIALLNNS